MIHKPNYIDFLYIKKVFFLGIFKKIRKPKKKKNKSFWNLIKPPFTNFQNKFPYSSLITFSPLRFRAAQRWRHQNTHNNCNFHETTVREKCRKGISSRFVWDKIFAKNRCIFIYITLVIYIHVCMDVFIGIIFLCCHCGDYKLILSFASFALLW